MKGVQEVSQQQNFCMKFRAKVYVCATGLALDVFFQDVTLFGFETVVMKHRRLPIHFESESRMVLHPIHHNHSSLLWQPGDCHMKRVHPIRLQHVTLCYSERDTNFEMREMSSENAVNDAGDLVIQTHNCCTGSRCRCETHVKREGVNWLSVKNPFHDHELFCLHHIPVTFTCKIPVSLFGCWKGHHMRKENVDLVSGTAFRCLISPDSRIMHINRQRIRTPKGRCLLPREVCLCLHPLWPLFPFTFTNNPFSFSSAFGTLTAQ